MGVRSVLAACLPRIRGPLGVIGLLLFGSAVLRLGGLEGRLMAEAASADAHMVEPAHDEVPARAEMPGNSSSSLCQTDEDLQRVLDALLVREHDVVQEEERINHRLAELAEAEREAEHKVAEAEAAERALKETMALSQTVAEDDLTQLTSVYQRMKPKSAAALFEEMEPSFSAGFLGRMDAGSAAAIMAQLSPEAAYSISVVMAGRNANAGQIGH